MRTNIYMRLMVWIFLLLCVPPPAFSQPPTSRILFIAEQNNRFQYDIFSINPDGRDPRNLTNKPGEYRDAVWSPDASRIVYTMVRDSIRNIWVISADGSDPHALTEYAGDNFAPAWSPDGRQIAFVSDRDGKIEIYVMNHDGSDVQRLTDSRALRPVWSPDGTQIAFLSAQDGNGNIFLMEADGSNPRNLTNSAGDDSDPAWSPDGTHIAFSAKIDKEIDIYVIAVDGSDLQNLTENNDADDHTPQWSPDGTQIAYVSKDNASPNRQIYLMNADGTDNINLSNSDSGNLAPAWSPDGTQIAFLSNRDGTTSSIYVMNNDGSNLQRLTFMGTVREPIWSTGTMGDDIDRQAPPTVEADVCPPDFAGFLSPRLQIGGRGRVIAGQSANRVRIAPTTGADLIGTIDDSITFLVVAGPHCDASNSMIWWQVQADNGLEGWTAEGVLPDEYFLEPT